MMNELALITYHSALERKKISDTRDYSQMHDEAHRSLLDEVKEFSWAGEVAVSNHLPGYTEAQEELADILIVCLIELHRRGTDIDKLIERKIKFNLTRV